MSEERKVPQSDLVFAADQAFTSGAIFGLALGNIIFTLLIGSPWFLLLYVPVGITALAAWRKLDRVWP